MASKKPAYDIVDSIPSRGSGDIDDLVEIVEAALNGTIPKGSFGKHTFTLKSFDGAVSADDFVAHVRKLYAKLRVRYPASKHPELRISQRSDTTEENNPVVTLYIGLKV